MIEHLILDGKSGIYPQQANGPVQVTESYTEHLGNFHQEGKPYADFEASCDAVISGFPAEATGATVRVTNTALNSE